MSQNELAKRVGVSQGYISVIESGEAENVGFELIREITEVFSEELKKQKEQLTTT